ncbi:unnamed protein product [Didymodactylos carnosus]|uniref:Uncharacterized protein n=1 Tax=Didymodactylos carnosus TaxID=1234261 RepID=A0A814ZEB2_9BILA|nr:unnamed protein product [Didymodactylos carnosus]CAF1545266.1 unnamed protein product [Didymodactylos carnosus]CAF4006516.1 unnamed protein product [Didymodactylos carnosus]CAF4334172.1 unnamed protein product [Didymodactylos carnosus]
MDKIQLNMQLIPGYIKTSLKIITIGSKRIIERLLPKVLENIETTTHECAQFANNSADKLFYLKVLTGKIVALTKVVDTKSNKNSDNIKKNLTALSIAKELHKTELSTLDQRYNERKQAVREAQQQYSNALNEIKTGIEGAFINVVHSINPLKAIPQLIEHGNVDGQRDAKYKAGLAQTRLREAEQQYEKLWNEIKQHHNKTIELVVSISVLNMTKISYDDLIVLLQEAMTVLGQLGEHWSNLASYFEKIANRANFLRNKRVESFILYTNSIQIEDRTFLEEIKESAIEIHIESYALFSASKTYVDISSKYILRQLGGLAKRIAPYNDTIGEQYLKELRNDTITTEKELVHLFEQRKAIYHGVVHKKQTELGDFIKKLDRAITDDKKPLGRVKGRRG